MHPSTLAHLRTLMLGSPHELASDADAYRKERRRGATPESALLQRLADTSPPHVVLGTIQSGHPVELPVRDLVGVQRWTVGATGAGKSAQVLAEEIQLIEPHAPWSMVHVDAKSESAGWLTDLFVPVLLAQWDSEAAIEEFVDGYQVINPFETSALPELNVLVNERGAPQALLAKEIAGLIAESLGPQGASFGIRMEGVLTYALRLALAIGGLSLLEVRSLLLNPAYLNGLLRFCDDPDVREYFVYRFPKEPSASIHAVVARLDLLLMLPDTQRVLCAPGCVDIAGALDGSLTVIDVGSPPRGAEAIGSWWMGLFVRRLARSIMGRPVGEETKPAFVIMDEWWTGLDAELAHHFERLLTLARYKRVGLWLINQLAGQVGNRFPGLLATLKNSCAMQIAFRQSFDDAKAMEHLLPVTGEREVLREPGGPPWNTRVAKPTEEKQLLKAELARMPERQFWFLWASSGLPAVHLHAPDVPFEEAKRIRDQLSPDLLAFCRRGRGGVSARALDSVLEHRRAHMRALEAGNVAHAFPDFSAPPPVVLSSGRETPSAPGAPARRPRRSPSAAADHPAANVPDDALAPPADPVSPIPPQGDDEPFLG
jgi:hypothetical protein